MPEDAFEHVPADARVYAISVFLSRPRFPSNPVQKL